jgi:adenine-specific DNA-methyltransferase
MEFNSTLNYIGSKKSLLEFLDFVVNKIKNKINKQNNDITFFDGFAGTGIVSKYFNKKYGFKNIANDMEYYSYIINYSNLKVPYTNNLKNIIMELNNLTETNNENFNLITKNYSPEGENQRLFWIPENTKKADAIIEKINSINITNDEKIFLIASLITSIDKVANTASVYEAYLKQFKKSAKNIFELKPVHTNQNIENNNEVYNLDINNEIILDNEYDIVYLDPPYNERQYSSNYNTLNYIARYDSNLEIYGKAGLIKNYNKSKFCSKVYAEKEFETIINKLNCKYILVSYNNEGIIPQDKFIEILKNKGRTVLYKKVYKKFKSSDKQNDEVVYEYLYLCSVGKVGEYKEYII